MTMTGTNKDNKISKRRAFALVSLIIAVFGVYAMRLFQIQIVEGESYAQLATRHSSTNIRIEASRGEILDRFLRPIAVNRPTYSVLFDYSYFPQGDQKRQNECILLLTRLLGKANAKWNDTLPISKTAPYAFEPEQEKRVAALKETLRMGEYATAEQCMAALFKEYKLDEADSILSLAERRAVAGVRYEMNLRRFAVRNPFVFSNDVSREVMYTIMENNALYPGVTVQPTPVREYVSGDLGAHLIGTVGPIYADEYTALKDKGYALNDVVGKSGIESAMEDALRGTTGTRTLVKDAKGTILEEKETLSPVPGKSVVLTLDLNLQAVAQTAIGDMITKLRQRPAVSKGGFANNGHDVTSGSVVLLDVKNGGVLVSATWPNYDLAGYAENYNTLLADPAKPLFNRALNGAFVCGSTMKPGVALAALTEGIITPSSSVYCNYEYTFYEGYTPRCMSRHRNISVQDALCHSCNIFFYDTGRRLGIDKMNQYGTLYGFGQKTGIEIGESAGRLDGPEYQKSIGGIWTGGDTLRAAIGQTGGYTPIQLAAYAMTIANDGVRYKTHLTQSIRSFDGASDMAIEPVVAARASFSQVAIDTVRAGMIDVTKRGTARGQFKNYSIAAKTGTAQVDGNHSDHGAFIAYAPAEKPEVAIAVLMENGTSGPSTEVARQVLDAYFATKTGGQTSTPIGELLP